MQKYTLKGIIKILTLSLISLSLLILLSVCYTFNIKSLLIKHTERQLEEMTLQSAHIINHQIIGDVNVLSALSECFTAHNITSVDEIRPVLQDVAQNDDYLRVLVSDAKGNVISSDQYHPKVWLDASFQEALKGDLLISNPLTDTLTHTPIITYLVPIKNSVESDHSVKSVIIGSKSISLILDTFQIPFFKNEGDSYIIDKDGTILFNPNEGKPIKNISELAKNNSEKNIKFFLEDIKFAKSGAKYMTINGEKSFIGYARVGSINDWSIIFCIPSSVIFDESLTIIKMTIIVSISVIFVALNVMFYLLYSKKKNESILHDLAFTDTLTGIYNFNKFTVLAKKILANRNFGNYALICFDIDKFKVVNDVLGYHFGDELLKNIGLILKTLPLNHYLYGRITNDDFIILMRYDQSKQITDVIEWIQHKISELETNKQTNLSPVLSCGIYIVPECEMNINTIRDKAFMAKDTIKGLHQQNYAFFDETIRTQLTKESHIDSAMSQALINGEFEVYYQPKVCLADQTYVGSEALIRWIHPTEGFISPNEFIPIAEKTGYITEISKWVIQKVCEDLKKWKNEGLAILPVSINLSKVDLYQVDLINDVKSTLREFEIDPTLIEFEITERVALNDVDYTKEILSKLKKVGCTISLDDFGTGYSSLSYLKSLPLDVLKIDKCFVDDIVQDSKSRDILSSIIHLAKSLHLAVVSEGVETLEQVAILKGFECDIVQGYIFAKPMVSKDFKNLL